MKTSKCLIIFSIFLTSILSTTLVAQNTCSSPSLAANKSKRVRHMRSGVIRSLEKDRFGIRKLSPKEKYVNRNATAKSACKNKIIKCTAPWCIYCKTDLIKDNNHWCINKEEQVKVIDIEESPKNRKICEDLGMKSLPFVVVVDEKGKKVKNGVNGLDGQDQVFQDFEKLCCGRCVKVVQKDVNKAKTAQTKRKKATAQPSSSPAKVFSKCYGNATIEKNIASGALSRDSLGGICLKDKDCENCPPPTPSPSPSPSKSPSVAPTPSPKPSASPTPKPSVTPTPKPSVTPKPTVVPSPKPSVNPTPKPSVVPSAKPSSSPNSLPTPYYSPFYEVN